VTRRVWRAGLHLLDHQIVDRNGRMVGNVDDLELEVVDGGAPVVTALLSGAAALAGRHGGRLGRWLDSLEHRLADGDTPSKIDVDLIVSVDSAVRLSRDRSELPTNRAERWVRARIIEHIPGAGHAPE
jgi:hypothetical protein